MGWTIDPYAFVPPGPPFTATDEEKGAYAKLTPVTVDLKDYPEGNEVLGIRTYIDTRLNEGHSVYVRFDAYNADTGGFLVSRQHIIPQPSTEGWDWWNWYEVFFWIGRSPTEISGPMRVRIETFLFNVPGEGSPEIVHRYFDVIDTPVEPPVSTGQITGKVTDKDTGNPLENVDVGLNGFNALTDSAGNYGFNDIPVGIYTIRFIKTGYQEWAQQVNVRQNSLEFINTQLVPEEEPPPEFRILPAPPPEFPSVFIPTYKELDLALYNENVPLAFSILRDHAWDEASPIAFLTALAAITGAFALIATLVGSYAFTAFLFEESLQTLDMALYNAQVNKQVDLQQQILAKKQEFIEGGIFSDVASWIPIANLINGVVRFSEASAFKLGIDNEIVNRKIAQVIQPQPGNIKGYSDALDAGLDPEPYVPLAPAILKINVNAEGGTVEWDTTGMSSLFPAELELAAGTYNVKVTAEGKEPLTKAIKVNPYEDKIVDYFLTAVPPEEQTFTLTISSTPTGAKIYIDNEFTFETTDTTINAPAGAHTITLKLDGYKDHNIAYDHTAGETIAWQVDLEPGTPEDPVVDQPEETVVIPLVPAENGWNSWKVTIIGRDSVTNEILNAWVLIDDVFKGITTPAVFYLAPESTFNIKLRLAGYRQGEITYITKPLPTS